MNCDPTTDALPRAYLGMSAHAEQHLDDAGEAFYQLWLDPMLTYSCARWMTGEPDTALETAQMRKLDFHIQQARAAGVDRVLDIGCGWGSMLRRLVDVHGVRTAVGLTLNPQQVAWTRRFDDSRIDVRDENWYDHKPEASYDAIVSIAAFEQFARPDLTHSEKLDAYRCFFERCHRWLRPGSWISLQTLGLRDEMPVKPLAQSGTVPIGPRYAIPTPAELTRTSEGLFEMVDLRDESHDSLRTTRVWLSRLTAVRPAACEVAGDETVRRYENVLKGAVMTLRVGILRMYRVALRRVGA